MKVKDNNVLVIGSGGRDNAIAYLFSKSPRVGKVFIAPGNGGSKQFAENVPIRDYGEMAEFAKRENIDLTFVGPEAPLSAGIVDIFTSKNLPIIGPNQKASRLESSKCDTKIMLKDLGVPIPEFEVFSEAEKARDYIESTDYPVVVKADGLAAGKGSLVCDDKPQAEDAVRKIMEEKAFGEAGERVIIEKRLYGQELSFFCFSDGHTILPMETAKDFKRARDNDEGKNTGGMGSFSPHPLLTIELSETIMEKVARPTIVGLREKYGIIYKGIIYFGLMFVKEKNEIVPYVLEINVRLGDPEAEAILPRLKTDIMDISEAILEEKLEKITLAWDPAYCLCLIAASGRTRGKKGWYKGYPDRYKIGLPITGIENISPDCLVFHCGTEEKDGQLLTTGGRVLALAALGATLEEARQQAYLEMKKVFFEGMYCRSDI